MGKWIKTVSGRRSSIFLQLILFLCLAGIFLTIPFFHMIQAHSPTGWVAPAKEKKVKNPVPNNKESRSRGQNIYMGKCAICHGFKGDGRGEMSKSLGPPPTALTDRHMMKEMTDGELFWKITTGKGSMPSYQKELTKNERWDLVNYIRSLAKAE